jgi:hypothetical protein
LGDLANAPPTKKNLDGSTRRGKPKKEKKERVRKEKKVKAPRATKGVEGKGEEEEEGGEGGEPDSPRSTSSKQPAEGEEEEEEEEEEEGTVHVLRCSYMLSQAPACLCMLILLHAPTWFDMLLHAHRRMKRRLLSQP